MIDHDEILFFKIAANAAGFGISEKSAELMIELYKCVQLKGGSMDLMDVTRIETEVNERQPK